MGLARKRRKKVRKLVDPEKEDRISNLPDEILGQILSFLPTKYSVATSSLASRWKNLYKLTSSLDFDDSISFKHQRKFVNSMLVLCKEANVTKFRLKCENKYFGDLLISYWIKVACSHKITELELSVHHTPLGLPLQLSISTCQNLVVLKLDCKLEVSVPYSVSFPCLQVLFFKGIELSTDCYLNEILYKSPLLEELVVEGCDINDGSISITNSLLRRLTLDVKFGSMFEVIVPDSVAFPWLKVLIFKAITLSTDCFLDDILYKCPLLEELVIKGCDIDEGNISITNRWLRRLTLGDGSTGPLYKLNGNVHYFNVPSLIYLKYEKFLGADGFTIRNFSALVEAHIQISFNDDDFDEPQDLSDAMLDLVIGVSNCELLYFSGTCLEALTSGDFELPVFQNLTRLELGVGVDVPWDDILLDFLNSSPCLESLIFAEGLSKFAHTKEKDYIKEIMLYDEEVPSCLESRLKVIKIIFFMGSKEEMNIIRYFLQKSNILEELEIHWYEGSKTNRLSKETEILKLEKASEICAIKFIRT